MTKEIKKVKDDLIAELDKRIADKIIEKTNADLLKKLIEQADTINEAIMIAELGTTYKRTGFHFDKRLEKMTDTIKYFKKNEKLSFVQDKNALTHKLIIGDNYDALLNLLIEYRGKIDVIYIDPPYGKDSMGEFAQTNYENAITRDNLLSMLYPRLVLARQLLSDNGVIFCSIDDKNHAYVKGLMDEIYSEKSFIGNINVLDNLKGKENDSYLSYTSHYVICYANKKREENGFNSVSTGVPLEEKYGRVDDEGDCYTLNGFKKTGASKEREERPYMFYPILWKDGKFFVISDDEYKKIYEDGEFDDKFLASLIKKYEGKGFSVTLPTDSNGKYLRWTSGFENYKQLIASGMLEYNEGTVSQRKYPKDIELIENSVFGTPKNFIYKKEFSIGTNELAEILDVKFDNPKSVDLIKYLVELVPDNENSTILDFFAGSGTTGQAVLELNKQDGGKRQLILVTLNEITDTTPNGIVNDVTSKRLKRVMTGECYDGTKDFKWNDKNKPLGDNLDVYDIATVAPYSDEPFTQIDETLYGQDKFGVNEKIKWVCENFEGTQKTLEDK